MKPQPSPPLVRLCYEGGHVESIPLQEDMPATAAAAHQQKGRWKFVSPSRCLDDGLAVWTEEEMQAALDKFRDRPPCRDYDSDCDDMTMQQICACRASDCPKDDHRGFCVMAQRQN